MCLANLLGQMSVPEMKTFIEESGVSRSMLMFVASGKRNPSAEVAARIAEASKVLHRKSNGRLPIVTRQEICATCANCPYTKRSPKDVLGC